MKTKFYFLLLFISGMMASCRSIDKMVEKGQYDEAFSFAVKKLAGEKNKETKYVKGLETAFEKLNKKDQTEIDRLSVRGKAGDLEKIYSIYQRMDLRQSLVDPLLPLISKDGYRAEFGMTEYTEKLSITAHKIADGYHNTVIEMIKKAEDFNDKLLAREAFYLSDKIDQYISKFDDSRFLKQKAYELGIFHIGVDIQNEYNGRYNFALNQKLQSINLSRLNSQWNKFEFLNNDEGNFDKYLVITVEELDFGPEREKVNNFEVKNEIQDGYIIVKGKNGKPLLDSLGKEIYEPKFIEVSALVTEIFREKLSSISAKIQLYDSKSSYSKETIPLHLIHEFKDSAVRYQGDKRAISNDMKNRIGGYLSDFPTDLDAVQFLGENLVAAVEKTAREIYIN